MITYCYWSEKVLNVLEGLSCNQGYLVSAESRTIGYISGPEIFKCEGEGTVNWLVAKVWNLCRPLWWDVYYRIQILSVMEQCKWIAFTYEHNCLGTNMFLYLFKVVKLKMINFTAERVFSFHIHAFYLMSGKGYTWKFLCGAALQLSENGL